MNKIDLGLTIDIDIYKCLKDLCICSLNFYGHMEIDFFFDLFKKYYSVTVSYSSRHTYLIYLKQNVSILTITNKQFMRNNQVSIERIKEVRNAKQGIKYKIIELDELLKYTSMSYVVKDSNYETFRNKLISYSLSLPLIDKLIEKVTYIKKVSLSSELSKEYKKLVEDLYLPSDHFFEILQAISDYSNNLRSWDKAGYSQEEIIIIEK